MKKWESPKILNLNIINTETEQQVCGRGLTGWYICGGAVQHCFQWNDYVGEIKCPTCGNTNITNYCGPFPSS